MITQLLFFETYRNETKRNESKLSDILKLNEKKLM